MLADCGHTNQGNVLAQKKIRVHELSKELGLTSKELLALAQTLGIGASSPSASIEDAQADRIRRKADAEGLRREVAPEEAAKAQVHPSRRNDTRGVDARRLTPPAPASQVRRRADSVRASVAASTVHGARTRSRSAREWCAVAGRPRPSPSWHV